MLMREKRMHDTRALEYMHQIASGVQHCHTLQLVLRNLKMQRIFFTSADHTTLAIGDFTDAELVPTRHCFVHDQKGSPVYVAPEVIACQPYDPFAADIWSMGVLFYFLLMGRYPFQASTPTELIKKITSATPDFSTASPRVSNTAKSLVGAMLSSTCLFVVSSCLDTHVHDRAARGTPYSRRGTERCLLHQYARCYRHIGHARY